MRFHTLRVFVILFHFLFTGVRVESSSTHLQVETAGNNATLRCHTSLDADVDWMYQTEESADSGYVYSNKQIYTDYKSRFSIESPSTGEYNLVITNVQATDAGWYICSEDGGQGQRHVINLTVNPNTSSVSNSSDNNIIPARISFNVRYVLVIVVPVTCVVVGLAAAIGAIVVYRRRRGVRRGADRGDRENDRMIASPSSQNAQNLSPTTQSHIHKNLPKPLIAIVSKTSTSIQLEVTIPELNISASSSIFCVPKSRPRQSGIWSDHRTKSYQPKTGKICDILQLHNLACGTEYEIVISISYKDGNGVPQNVNSEPVWARTTGKIASSPCDTGNDRMVDGAIGNQSFDNSQNIVTDMASHHIAISNTSQINSLGFGRDASYEEHRETPTTPTRPNDTGNDNMTTSTIGNKSLDSTQKNVTVLNTSQDFDPGSSDEGQDKHTSDSSVLLEKNE